MIATYLRITLSAFNIYQSPFLESFFESPLSSSFVSGVVILAVVDLADVEEKLLHSNNTLWHSPTTAVCQSLIPYERVDGG